MAMMRILGIDPGTATVGYGLIDIIQNRPVFCECGIIETHKSAPMIQRLHEIGQDLAALIQEYKPQVCVVEELFFLKNVTNGISVAQARGIIIYEAMKANVTILEFTPLQMKAMIAGHGRANKLQVGSMVKSILQLESIPKPDDAADALGLAVCGFLATRNKKLTRPGHP